MATAAVLAFAFVGSLVVGALQTAGEQKELQKEIDTTNTQHDAATLALEKQITQTQLDLGTTTTDIDTATTNITAAETQLTYDLDTLRLQKAMDVGANRASAAARGLGSGGTAGAIEDYIKMLADRNITQTDLKGQAYIRGLTNQKTNLENKQTYLSGLLSKGGYYEQQRSLLEQDYNTNMNYLTEQTTSGAQGLSVLGHTIGNFLPFIGAVL